MYNTCRGLGLGLRAKSALWDMCLQETCFQDQDHSCTNCPSIPGTSSDEDHMSHENKKAVENLRALSVKSTAWVQTLVPPVISGVILG